MTDYPVMHPVDILAIATKSNPVPVKDLTGLGKMTEDGIYMGGRDIVAGLQENKFKCSVEGTKMKISRWMMLKVDQEPRTTAFDKERSIIRCMAQPLSRLQDKLTYHLMIFQQKRQLLQ